MAMEVETEIEMEMRMEMEMEMQMQMQMQMEMEMEVEMDMEMVMVIFGARKVSSEFRFASKSLLTSDFEVLEASGAPKGDQEKPKKSPSHDPRYIHRFPSLQELSRRSPSHDLSALSTS